MKKRETLFCESCGKEINIGDYFYESYNEDIPLCEDCGAEMLYWEDWIGLDDEYGYITGEESWDGGQYDGDIYRLTQNGRLLDEAMEEDLTEELAWFLGNRYILVKYNSNTGDHHIRVFKEDKTFNRTLEQFSIVFTIKDEPGYEQVSYDISTLTEEMVECIKRYLDLDVRSMADTRTNNELFDRD